MPIPRRALNLGLAAMRRLYSAWRRLTALRKAIVVSFAAAVVIAALKDAFDVFTMLAVPCTILLLLIWGISRLFGLLGGSKWSPNIRVALALAVVVGFFLFCGFMAIQRRVSRHPELNGEIQEVTIERNKVRIGMTANNVLRVVHGMEINAWADGVWLSGLPGNQLFYYSPPSLSLVQHDDGTFNFWCYCGRERVSRTSRVTEPQVLELIKEKPKQALESLTESQAAVLMQERMSGGYEWHWKFTFLKDKLQPSFTVTFGLDGRVKEITDVHTTDPRAHRP